MGNQGALSPKTLTTGRLKVDLKKEIQKLNIDKMPLLKLMDLLGKEKATQMEYKHLYKERRPSWGEISSFGGSWASGANKGGTIVVPSTEAWMYSAGDIIKCPTDSDVNIYVDSVSQSTYTLTCHTYDDSTTIDFSAGTTGANKILLISNSFELGSGKGTIKSQQPSESTNYIQIVQHPYGVVKTMQDVEYDAGMSEFKEQEQEIFIEHLFSMERLMFFGQKLKATTGYMDAVYEQFFTGGANEAITTNVTTETDLTQAEFGTWINQSIYYAKNPVVFASERIFEAMSWWLGQKLQTKQDETTLGIAVSTYRTQYGDTVKVIPHRELFKNYYNGYAFCLDLADVRYKFLQGNDTHLEVGIQQPGVKQEINEFRTWFGFWMGNEKRHGVLKGVQTISA